MKKTLWMFLSIIAAVLLLAPAALGKDSVAVSIPSGGALDAIQIDENGNPYAPGTFAVGTIKLHYTNSAYAWEPGEFAEFTMNVKVRPGKPKPPTNYSVPISFRQVGSGLELEVTDCENVTGTSFAGGTLIVDGNDAEANCKVKVRIPTVDPAMNFDGALLVGNLRMDTPPGSHLDTVPLIQARVMLVEPTACLRLFNMITDFGIDNVVDLLTINIQRLNHPTQAGNIQNTSPNNIADVAYVVNTCGNDIDVDLKMMLQENFAAPSTGNPVHFFSSASFNPGTDEVTDGFGDTFAQEGGATAWGNGCFTNRLVAAQSTMLVRASIDLISTEYDQLPGPPSQASPNGIFQSFVSKVYFAETNCVDGQEHTNADPNQVVLPLNFTVDGW